jgi:hypothetical protein
MVCRKSGRSFKKGSFMTSAKRYLGDAVYVERDERGIVLTTEDGIRATNTIVLEPEVIAALEEYLKELRSRV